MDKSARAALLTLKGIAREKLQAGGKPKYVERALPPSPALVQLNDGSMSGFDPTEAALRIVRELSIPVPIKRSSAQAAPEPLQRQEPMAYAPAQRRESLRPLPPSTPAAMPLPSPEPVEREETLWDIYNRTGNAADFVRADEEMMARQPMQYGGVPEEGEVPRNFADAQRMMEERRAAELAQSQAALQAELGQLQATPEWQAKTAEEINRQSFSPERLQSMTPPTTAESLGLPSFTTPQQQNLESNNAVAMARALENAQNRQELGAALKETWPVKLVEDTVAAAKMPGEALAGRFDPQKDPERAVKGMFDLAGVVTSGGLPLASRDPNQLNVLAGVRAKTADTKKLELAQTMRDEGVPVEKIWQETGWWNAPDGKWRFEIPDQSMEVGHIPRFAAKPMESAIIHPQLFKAYPELLDMPIRQQDLGLDGPGGFYQPGPNNTLGYIVVNSQLDPERARSVALHEIQHAVQHIEKFSAGAAPEMFQFDAATINKLKENRAALEQASDVHNLVAQGYNFDDALAALKKSYGEDWLPQADQYALADPQRLAKNIDDINLALQLPRRGGLEGYSRTAGEVEARNVQERAGPGPRNPDYEMYSRDQMEANREQSPGMTQEFGPREQVFRSWDDLYGAPSMSAAPEAPPRNLNDIGLYSFGQESAAALPQARGTPQQMKAMLERAGVKPDELKGFDEAFAGQKQITREQAAAFFEERMPKIEEKVLGARPPLNADELFEYETLSRRFNDRDMSLNLDDATRMAELQMKKDRLPQAFAPSKYEEYTIPGSENYREVLLKLPPQWQPKIEEKFGRFGFTGPDGQYREYWTRQQAEQASRSTLRMDASQFVSSHWDDPNVLAHLRMADRYGPNGERMLHVEEMQSDWAQAGRKEGFKKDGPDPYEEYRAFTKKMNEDWIEQHAKQAFENNPGAFDNLDAAKELAAVAARGMTDDRMAAIMGRSEEFKRVYDAVNKNRVNSAPYVTNTAAWTDLSLKRILKEAADNNYDSVVWTPGKQQAERYNLSKQISELSYDPSSGTIYGYREGLDRPIFEKKATIDKLPDYVGKEVAEKLMNQQPNDYGRFVLRGQEMDVGGSGMKGYYDKIVPGQLQKMLKKLDPSAKLSTYSLMDPQAARDIERAEAAIRNLAPIRANWERKLSEPIAEAAKQQAREQIAQIDGMFAQRRKEIEDAKKKTIEMMQLQMTPRLREAVRKGLPAFKRGGAVQPTQAQIDAGNYKKDHRRFAGLDIAIENKKGTMRSGIDGSGKKWSVQMPADYGYIKRTEGADGDHVDVYLGPDEKSDRVVIVNQRELGTKKFDEHKVLLGFKTKRDALRTYIDGFSDGKGPERVASTQDLSIDEFKKWLKNGNTKKVATENAIDKALKLTNQFGAGAAQKAVKLARSTTGDARK